MGAREDKPAPPIEQMLGAMEAWGASDLLVSAGKPAAVRLHGSLVALEVPPARAEEIERFAELALGARMDAVLSKGGADVAFALPNGARFRVGASRESSTLTLAIRALPRTPKTLDELGLPAMLASFVERKRGLVLIAGSAGSGKSTTLAALVRQIITHRPVHVATLEDPIEELHEDRRGRVTQRELDRDVPSVGAFLERARREGADVVVLGQIASSVAARAALDAALGGQLVLATLEAVDTARALARLIGMLPEGERARGAQDLAATFAGAAALRLLPLTGGVGRAAAVEMLGASHDVVRLIREERLAELDDLLAQEQAPGILSFDAALEALARRGQVTAETALAHASHIEGFVHRMRGSLAHSGELGQHSGLDVQTLLSHVTRRGASDLHLSVGRPPTLRVDGQLELQGSQALTSSDLDALARSIMSPAQRTRFAQEHELDFSLGYSDGKRFRVNAYHERGNVAIAFRAITSTIPDATMLGLPPAVLQMGEEPHGLLLVVGPTGAGKTTTLACLTDRINHERACHIITIEDPIEYVHKSDRATIHQREVGSDTGSFAEALKYVLRQDPDVLLVGELRDFETVSAALTAAETGHLVMATLHTNDAIQTIDRIIDVFPPHQQSQARAQLSASLIGVVSQRLLPRADRRGRLAAFEVMVATPAIRTLIREAKMHQALGVMQTSRSGGMVTMEQALEELLRRGAIDKDEALRYMQGASSSEKSRSKTLNFSPP